MTIIGHATQRRQAVELAECTFCGHLGADVHRAGLNQVGVYFCDDLDECLYRMDRQEGVDAPWHLFALSPMQRRRLDLEVKV